MDTDLTEIRPLERHVDTLLRIDVADGGSLLLAIEAQGKQDPDKRSSWAYYLAQLYAKFRYPCVLLVVCRDKGTAEWAAEPIRIGLDKHPSLVALPLVLGPHNVPMVTDAARAADDIPMAVFSAITHSNDHDIAAILEALAAALRTTDPDAAAVFAEFTEAGLGATPAREIWRKPDGHWSQSLPRLRRRELPGRRSGRRPRGRPGRGYSADSRGARCAVPDEARRRITACKDLTVLDVWFERAVTATTVDAVLAEI